jgi:hypothetical protein
MRLTYSLKPLLSCGAGELLLVEGQNLAIKCQVGSAWGLIHLPRGGVPYYEVAVDGHGSVKQHLDELMALSYGTDWSFEEDHLSGITIRAWDIAAAPGTLAYLKGKIWLVARNSHNNGAVVLCNESGNMLFEPSGKFAIIPGWRLVAQRSAEESGVVLLTSSGIPPG